MAAEQGAGDIAAAFGGARRVQTPLLLLAAVVLLTLPIVRHARNRLLSGQPVGLGPTLAAAGPAHAAALGLSCLLLLAPTIRPTSPGARWAGLLGAGLALGALAATAAAAADALASGPASRTAIGAGGWAFAVLLLLLAADGASRIGAGLGRRAVAVVLVLAPLGASMAHGDLAGLALAREFSVQRALLSQALGRHLVLVATALVPALLIGIPLGIWSQRRRAVGRTVFPVLNLIQTIPSIALFGLLIGPLSALGTVVPGVAGVGLVPAVIALVLFSLLPIVRNTAEGLDTVPAPVRLAASGMGMSAWQTFWRVDAPLALPIMLSGLRITVVQAIGLAAVSALIGAGGLGAVIFQGLFANALDLVLLGALPVIALAATADLLLRLLTDWSRTRLGGSPAPAP